MRVNYVVPSYIDKIINGNLKYTLYEGKSNSIWGYTMELNAKPNEIKRFIKWCKSYCATAFVVKGNIISVTDPVALMLEHKGYLK